MANLPFIKKFSFKSFDSEAYNELSSLNYTKYVNSSIIDNFLMDDNYILAVLSFYDEEDDDRVDYDYENGYSGYRNLDQNQPNGFILSFYTYNLKKWPVNDIQIYLQINPDLDEDYIYCKSIYLKDFYIAFIYFSDLYDDGSGRTFIYFEIYKLDIFRNLPIDNPILSRIIGYFNKDVNFKDILSDFVKIDNNRLVFITTEYTRKKSRIESDESTKLKILLIDFFGGYSPRNSKIRQKEIIFNSYKFHYQISGFAYNGYLLFSSTVTKSSPESSGALEDSLEYNSLFMIFGYANGTDEIIDISPYFNDTPNYQEDISFLEYLFGKIKIENNLFGYFPVLAIKIISIPEEISIFDEKKNINITNNSLFEDLDNEKIHKLFQNKNLIKTSQYYYLDYQYILMESNSLRPNTLRILDIEIEKGQRIYYGRTNRLKFKLCHDYCEACNEISTYKDNQKCLSCLPLYQYDYWYYKDDTFEGNCVPEEQFYDINERTLISCQEDYKFYVNTTDNKTICFDKDYNCPELYPYFNDTTRECLYCSYERYKAGDCALDDNRTNNSIHDNIKGIIRAFSENDNSVKSLKMIDKNNFYFKITTTNEQSSSNQSPSNPLENSRESIIDLKECTDILKREYGYDNDTNFIILKYENDADTNDKSVQYEVYAPGSDTKLDLSVCSEVKIDIYIPVILDEKTQELYDDLKAQGYNLFDKNDKFYKDICTPYKSPNGTDVLLSDRFNDFFLANQLTCQANCEYSNYNPDTGLLKCECDIVDEEINTEEPTKITAKSIGKSFYNVLKYSNYKVLICYKLVFRNETFKTNIGSSLTIIYFSGYFAAFLIFCYKKISYLQIEIEKLFQNNKNNNEKDYKDEPIIINQKADNMTKKIEFKEQQIFEKKPSKIINDKEQNINNDNSNNNFNSINNNKINNNNDNNSNITKNINLDNTNNDNINIITKKKTKRKRRKIKKKSIKFESQDKLKDKIIENWAFVSKEILLKAKIN